MAIKSIINNTAAYQDVAKVNSGTNYSANDTLSAATVENGGIVNTIRTSEEQDKSFDDGHQKNSELNKQRLKNAVNQANNAMKHTRTGCEFAYHEETNRISIKVYDKDTKEVLREIPPEESLEVLERIWEVAGLLVDERR